MVRLTGDEARASSRLLGDQVLGCNNVRNAATIDEREGSTMKEYKVLSERGSGFKEIDPENLEATLNGFAAEGWRVVNSFSVFAVGRNSSITTILERDVNRT
jgi:hypothetical protein